MAIKKINEFPESTNPGADWFFLMDDGAGGYYKVRRSVIESGGGGTTLTAPTLSATAISSTQINLSWNNVANESSYQLQRSPAGANTWADIAAPAADATSFNNTGLTASTAYDYRIRAVGNGTTFLTSPWSNIASATTSGAFSGTYLTFTPLDSDFELYNSNKGVRLAAAAGDNVWNLQWANQTLATGQRLVVRIDDANMQFMAGVHLNNTATAYGDTFSAIRLIGDGTIGWHNANGGSYNRGPETVDRTYYAIFKDGADSYTFQKSNDLVTWTSIGASIPAWSFGNPVPIFITSDGVDLDGYLEIFTL